jgi:hypothetical protein
MKIQTNEGRRPDPAHRVARIAGCTGIRPGGKRGFFSFAQPCHAAQIRDGFVQKYMSPAEREGCKQGPLIAGMKFAASQYLLQFASVCVEEDQL